VTFAAAEQFFSPLNSKSELEVGAQALSAHHQTSCLSGGSDTCKRGLGKCKSVSEHIKAQGGLGPETTVRVQTVSFPTRTPQVQNPELSGDGKSPSP
jgi:hypothetical protein